MLESLFIALEAHHDGLNHHRRYELSVGRDLFQHWTVTIRYGRVGSALQQKHFADAQIESMQAVVTERLRRRLSAQRRLGCPYLVRELAVRESLTVADWIPAQVLEALVLAER